MKKIFLAVFLLLSAQCFSQLNIVPVPVELKMIKEGFTINEKTTLCYNSKMFHNEVALLSSLIKSKYGITLKEKFIKKGLYLASGKIDIDSNSIYLIQQPAGVLSEKDSAHYILSVGKKGITIFCQ